MLRTPLSLLAAALCALALCVPGAVAAPAEFAGSSADGEKVFFTTAAKLVPGDTDNGFVDVYERFYDGAAGIEAFVTREISTGPTGGNDSYNVTFDGISKDGNSAFFSTAESLVDEDEDHSRDVYERDTVSGETTLLSGASALCATCVNAEVPVTFVGATPTGSKVFFATSERLVEADGDGAGDVYARDPDADSPLLATPGTSAPATFLGASADGSQVIFETTDKLSLADTDSEADIYERDLGGGTTRLVSVNGTCPASLAAEECAPVYRSTAAGGQVFFETKAQLVGGDSDKFQDVYQWSPLTGTASLISVSSEGEEGKGEFDAVFAGVAAAGATVYFETTEQLSSGDKDEANDVYEQAGGSTTLISSGSADMPAFFNAASSDGTTVVFSTVEPLSAGDQGEESDVYERNGSTPLLISGGSSSFASTFAGSSSDASHVFYVTSQQLNPADLDANPDIYKWAGGLQPTLISVGPVGGNDIFTPHLSAVSEDAGHAFFTTPERLTATDNFATETDVYDRTPTETVLVSVGNSAQLQLGPPAPSLTGTNPASPNPSTEPRILGQAEAGASIKLYPTADCSGAPAETGTAAELNSTGVKVVVEAGSATTFHATATNSSGDTSACSPGSVTYVQQDAPAPPAEEGGQEGGSSGGGSTPPDGGGTSSTESTGGSKPAGTPAVIKIGNFLYVAPLTRITFGPLAKTRSRRPVFQFVDATEQPNTRFICRIDRKSWRPCSSPYRPKRLSLHKHVFAVKGQSFAGQWEQHPVLRKFKVVGR
ncbi:MAG TPA: hypothetical protein VGW80_11370 [Solirubrobacterales bacterium]|nr:hypothetical protein [Solirubrobacterales bacterium]